MDIKVFTKKIVNRETVNFVDGRRRIIAYGDKCAYYFKVGHPYIYCSYAPNQSMNGNDWKKYWIDVVDVAIRDARSVVVFHGVDKTYNTNNGVIAIIVKDEIFVCQSKDISEPLLNELGFSKRKFFVPLSNGEAWYDISDISPEGSLIF